MSQRSRLNGSELKAQWQRQAAQTRFVARRRGMLYKGSDPRQELEFALTALALGQEVDTGALLDALEVTLDATLYHREELDELEVKMIKDIEEVEEELEKEKKRYKHLFEAIYDALHDINIELENGKPTKKWLRECAADLQAALTESEEAG